MADDIPLLLPQERLRILSNSEIEALYGYPCFTLDEQAEYFSLSLEEKLLAETLHSFKSRIFFILQLGYFKARRQFFTLSLEQVASDVNAIRAQYFPDSLPVTELVAKATRLKHQQTILALFNYQYFSAQDQKELRIKAQQLVRLSAKPIVICRELLQHLHQQNIVLPGYRLLQDIISQTLLNEQKRLIQILQNNLTTSDLENLQKLLADTPGLYEITQLKQEPRNFREGEIKRELKRGQQLKPLYQRATVLIPYLDISRESVKYYASLVGYYSVYKLNRMDTWQVYVYLLCFAYHRIQRLYDNLIHSFLYQGTVHIRP